MCDAGLHDWTEWQAQGYPYILKARVCRRCGQIECDNISREELEQAMNDVEDGTFELNLY
jgi:hypothetical protein